MNIRQKLKDAGLRITQQRLVVFENLANHTDHPTVDKLITNIRKEHPNIGVGTIYNILETFVKKKLIVKISTEKNAVRYDASTEKHHHLYTLDSARIEDYFDKKLNKIIENYLSKVKIPNFEISDFRLQIIGKFNNSRNKKNPL